MITWENSLQWILEGYGGKTQIYPDISSVIHKTVMYKEHYC